MKKQKSTKQRLNYSMQTKGNSLRRYHSYLLRIWCEDDMLAWRFQLEDPNTHEVIGFQNMEKLLCFLNEQVFHSNGSIT